MMVSGFELPLQPVREAVAIRVTVLSTMKMEQMQQEFGGSRMSSLSGCPLNFVILAPLKVELDADKRVSKIKANRPQAANQRLAPS